MKRRRREKVENEDATTERNYTTITVRNETDIMLRKIELILRERYRNFDHSVPPIGTRLTRVSIVHNALAIYYVYLTKLPETFRELINMYVRDCISRNEIEVIE